AIDVLVSIQQLVQNIYISPIESYSANLTLLHTGGESLKIIPGAASFATDLPAQKNEILYQLQTEIDEKINHISTSCNVAIKTEWIDMTPGAEVSGKAAAIAEAAIREVVGDAKTMPAVVTSGSDDFHFYTIHDPSLKATMI